MPGTLSPPPRVSNPDMHHGTCVAHVPWCMSGSLISGFLWNRWQGKRSRHSRRMCNPQFCVSGKRPVAYALRLEIPQPHTEPSIFQVHSRGSVCKFGFGKYNLQSNLLNIYQQNPGKFSPNLTDRPFAESKSKHIRCDNAVKALKQIGPDLKLVQVS